MDLTDFPDIYGRIIQCLGVKTQKAVAEALGMTPQMISNLLKIATGREDSKGAKNLPYKQLIEWALRRGVSVDWLLTGKESSQPTDKAEEPTTPEIQALLGQARQVLESDLGPYPATLAQTIKTLHQAMGATSGRPQEPERQVPTASVDRDTRAILTIPLYCPNCKNKIKGSFDMLIDRGAEAEAEFYCLSCGFAYEPEQVWKMLLNLWGKLQEVKKERKPLTQPKGRNLRVVKDEAHDTPGKEDG